MRRGEDILRRWHPYLFGFGVFTLITLVSYGLRARLTPAAIVVCYLLGVVVTALRTGRGPALLTAAAGTIVFDLVFMPPDFIPVHLSFDTLFSGPRYALTLGSLLVAGVVIAALAGGMRDQRNAARQREEEITALYDFSRDLAVANALPRVLEVCARHIGRIARCRVALLLPVGGKIRPHRLDPDFPSGEAALAVAAGVFASGRSAQCAPEPATGGSIRYLPLRTSAGVIGVLGLAGRQPGESPAEQPSGLMETLASQAALAIERALLEEQSRQAQLLHEKIRLQKALLDSISHDLRTPLSTITGAMSTLLEDGGTLDEPTRAKLVGLARQEAERLNYLVGNLLDMTRLEAGAIQIKREPHDLREIVAAALARIDRLAPPWPVRLVTQPELPLVPVDFVLVSQVLVNLLDNAMKYSPPGAPIEVEGCLVDGQLEIAVADRGPGIPPDERTAVFEKFYRVRHRNVPPGSGLGLSICKGFVEAQGGRIWAEAPPAGGTRIVFTLPLEPAAPLPKEHARV